MWLCQVVHWPGQSSKDVTRLHVPNDDTLVPTNNYGKAVNT